jgi:HD-like signal output (HDOD) protein
MGTINVEDLAEGLTLAGNVTAPNGRFLLPEGTVLNTRHIGIFKAWGVTEVEILEQTPPGVQVRSLSRQALQESLKALEPYFQLADTTHPAVKELLKQAVRTRAKSVEQGERPREDRPDLGLELDQARPAPLPDQAGPGELERLLDRVSLISLPDIYYKIMDLLESRHCSAHHLAEVVSKDSSLAARLLRLVNSPLYGFSTRVDTVSRAIALLGLDKLTTLAQGIAVIRAFDSISSELLDMEKFWKHSIACGVYARLLASQQAELSEERFFVAGLLHDIGRLVLIKTWPEHFAGALRSSLKEKVPLHQAEKQVFGLDHAALGGMLCAQWRFPPGLGAMIQSHHAPGASDHAFEASVVHMADIMAHAMGVGTSGNAFVPALDHRAWETLQFSPGTLSTITIQARHQLADILETFLIPGKGRG